MSPVSLERIEAEAMQLDRDDRVALVERLLASLDDDSEMWAVGDVEIEARVRAAKAGEACAIGADKVFELIEKRIEVANSPDAVWHPADDVFAEVESILKKSPP